MNPAPRVLSGGREPGTIAVESIQRVWSPERRNRRTVDVYLPPSYQDGRDRYPVIYMHDGQNLSDPASAFAGTWRLAETLSGLADEGIEAIVVGVHHRGRERIAEFAPYADPRYGRGQGDKYIAFLANTLKPRIDRRYRTLRTREHTLILGSSMGGLISLYAFFRLKQVFGAVGAMSPSLWFGERRIFDTIGTSWPKGKVYLDVGTNEGAATLRDARHLAERLTGAGYRRGRTGGDRRDRSLMYVEDEGGRHSEFDWARRLAPAITFLLS
jgi:predicted alpha/beta superfamily hydrolase